MPQAFTKEVRVGNEHAFVQGNNFRRTKLGLFDSEILCGRCDHKIGRFEGHAFKSLTKARKSAPHLYGFSEVEQFDGNQFLRFCSGLLWKYSVTKEEFGRIDLGSYQEILRQIAFNGADIPESIDAFLILLKRFPSDTKVISYRAPLPILLEGLDFIRFWVGGFVVFVKLDERQYDSSNYSPYFIRNQQNIRFRIAPAELFEEFNELQRLVLGNQRLSKFLDEQEGR